MTAQHDRDPLQPHAHDPNPRPPTTDPTIILQPPGGPEQRLDVATLDALTHTTVPECYIVSTGHGTSGPFTFGGVQLLHLIRRFVQGDWNEVEVLSADGFGNRIWRHELEKPSSAGPIILATRIDGHPLTRQDGLVRLIVPSERDDALRQVKWVARINVRRERESTSSHPPAPDH